jgi:Flp pilus assembly protein TadB
MERQTSERVDLYTRRLSPGDPLPINVDRIEINDDAPLDEEIRIVVSELSDGRAAGASGMRAEHVKEWLRGI